MKPLGIRYSTGKLFCQLENKIFPDLVATKLFGEFGHVVNYEAALRRYNFLENISWKIFPHEIFPYFNVSRIY